MMFDGIDHFNLFPITSYTNISSTTFLLYHLSRLEHFRNHIVIEPSLITYIFQISPFLSVFLFDCGSSHILRFYCELQGWVSANPPDVFRCPLYASQVWNFIERYRRKKVAMGRVTIQCKYEIAVWVFPPLCWVIIIRSFRDTLGFVVVNILELLSSHMFFLYVHRSFLNIN